LNARATNRELSFILKGSGATLRLEHEVKGPPPDSLVALLKNIEMRVVEAERERLIVKVNAQVDELLRAAGRR
jgi:hypothetical protein